MAKLTAFIARSFAPADEERLRPTLSFLKTFHTQGFICQDAERADVESVSLKVRKFIDQCDVFLGFFTKKYRYMCLQPGWKGAIEWMRGQAPEIWNAPPWVLQESGYALKADKHLILLREPSVEVPGLQGDLEYIPFNPEDPASVFPKLSEMINSLLAKASGTVVDVQVSHREPEAQVLEAPAPDTEIQKEARTTDNSDIIDCLVRMLSARDNRNLDELYASWRNAQDMIESGNSGNVDRVELDAYYFQFRFQAGAADALEVLRRLSGDNPSRAEPLCALAKALFSAEEYGEAARHYLEAARLSTTATSRVDNLLAAGRCHMRLQEFKTGQKVAFEALSIAEGDQKLEASSLVYDFLKESGEKHFAFGIGEAALHENPQNPLRFRLGLDFHRNDLYELFMYHFKYLWDRNQDDSSALHNLALAYEVCKLPMLSVAHYKQAFGMGETLAAANLGFNYVEAGMEQEAMDLIARAVEIEGYEPRVDKCLVEIEERKKAEEERLKKLLKDALEQKDRLVSLGCALSNTLLHPIDGLWQFPFAKMQVSSRGELVEASGQATREELANRFFGLLSRTEGQKTVATDKYTLNGNLTGSVCKFTLKVDTGHPAPLVSLLAGTADDNREGFIMFEPNGAAGHYCELKGGKLAKLQPVSRTTPALPGTPSRAAGTTP